MTACASSDAVRRLRKNPEPGRDYAPYLVDVQADLLSNFPTRLVVPFVTEALCGRRIARLHPLLTVADARFVLATQLAAAIDRRRLRLPVLSMITSRDPIIAAIDVLLAGV